MTVPHYGKRNPGGLTAASPGDTLYFNYGSFNDSGDSEAQSGFSVSDIELFKNGVATARATDSGYSLISDTGQMGDRVGLNRFSVQVFNTSDDTGFYDAGSWYQVAVDNVTIDGKTVRFWAGSFEIGTPRANIVEIDGDTGPADNLGRIAGDTGSDSYLYRELDTGAIAVAVWAKDVRALTAFAHDTGVADTVWKYAGRKLAVDTGIGEQVWSTVKTGNTDTGTFGEELAGGVSIAKIVGDTGAARHLAQLADEYDTGRLPAEASATLDTGALHAAVWQVPSGNANRTLTNIDTGAAIHLAQMADEYDTGRLPAEATATLDTGAVNNAVWNGSISGHQTAGTFGRELTLGGGILIDTTVTGTPTSTTLQLASGSTQDDFYNDQTFHITSGTGVGQARVVLDYDGGTKTITVDEPFAITPASSDGIVILSDHVHPKTQIAEAIWDELDTGHQDTGTFGRLRQNVNVGKVRGDTGAAAHLAQLGDEYDTGRLPAEASATLDTGAINRAVWNADASRTLTGWAFDTGVQQKLDRYDTGVRNAITQLQTKTDTGVPSSVWASATRTLTGFAFDTGIQQALARVDTGLSETIDRILADTDTGLKTVPAAIKAKTDSLTFTVAGQVDANIQYVNDTQIQGTGDTGTADTWRPV